MRKVFAVIVTFNPEITTLITNITSIANQVDQVIVVDNGSDNLEGITQHVNAFKNITISSLGKNSGIAAATNFGIKKIGTNGSWVLILDQDSVFPENGISIYKEYLKLLNDFNIGMLVPVYMDRNNVLNLSNDKNVHEWEFVEYPIASGSFVNYDAWEIINGYDEELFIDRVDDDFDLRMRLNSFKLVQVNSVQLNHAIGNIVLKKILGKTFIIYNHNAFRKYYQSRNNIIFAKKHRKFGDAISREVILVVKTIFFESDKISKLIAIFNGIVNGLDYTVKDKLKGK